MPHFFSIVALLVFFAMPSLAAEPCDLLEDVSRGGTATVVTVIDGDTIVLDDGRAVRLVGIQAPKLPLGRAGFEAWPLAAEAKAYLESLVLQKTVTLCLPPQAMDRHGRVLAHVVRASDGLWIQGSLLGAGLARVYTFPDNRVLANPMLALERQARADRTGMWGLPYYALRTADNVRHDVGSFQIVEGRVVDATRIRDRVYLNFGADWRTDFTIKVMARDEKRFVKNAIDILTLKGHRVRVRGWIKSRNGAMIELDHPERLEVLNP